MNNENQKKRDVVALNEKYIVVQTTQAPYSNSSAIDALEAALAASNIGIKVVFIFVGAGVLQLHCEQQTNDLHHKNIYKKLHMLPLYDIDEIYVDEYATKQYKVDINNTEFIRQMCKSADIEAVCKHALHVLVF